MLKKRVIKLVIAVALIAGIAGGSEIVADGLGVFVTGQVSADNCTGGGSC